MRFFCNKRVLCQAATLLGGASSCTQTKKEERPFVVQRLERVVLRCGDLEKQTDFYVNVLGAEPEWLGRLGGLLSHLRLGESLIDLQSERTDIGKMLHAGGQGTSLDRSYDPELGSVDHVAFNVDMPDPDAVVAYLTRKGYAPFQKGRRYGAEGDALSVFIKDPEGNVVELRRSRHSAKRKHAIFPPAN